MKNDWEKYEVQAATLYETLGRESGIKIISVGVESKIDGRQVDVLFQQSNGLQTIRTAIECKDWKDKIPAEKVDALASKIRKLGIDKGIIVAPNGFQPAAISSAKYWNISLVEMREPTDADWEGLIRSASLKIHAKSYEPYEISFSCSSSDLPPQLFGIDFGSCEITKPESSPQTLYNIVKDQLHEEDEEDIEVNFPPGTMLRVRGEDGSAQINRFNCKIRYSEPQFVSEIHLDFTKDVHLFVKSLFEDRKWHWLHDGRIVEVHDWESTD